MSPARTKEAFNSMVEANEITGTVGQVLGFDASGNAATVKLTRTITVPLVAETVTVTAQAGARRILAPFAIKLTEIRFYVVTAGTTATTIDVNVGGTSILNAPVSVSANSTYASTTSFTALSTGTIALNGVISFDIDAAGTGARGVQVTLVGNEV
jgi:hypothetical protein